MTTRKTFNKSSLFDLAADINRHIQEEEAGRVVLGKLLIEAQCRVHRESNLTFKAWCENHLRKTDGSPFSYLTIKHYMRLARLPGEQKRKNLATNERIKRGRRALALVRPIFDEKTSVSEQVNLLMTAWEHSSDSARKQFLKMIGVTP